MGSHSVTYNPTEVIFPPFTPAEWGHYEREYRGDLHSHKTNVTSNYRTKKLLTYMQNRITHGLALDELAEVARHLLEVPAVSTSSERSFSVTGRTIEDRKTRLSSDSVDGLMFLHGLAVTDKH